MASPLQRLSSRLSAPGSGLVSFARNPLDYSFPANTALADAGDVLLDEQRAIVLRRKILARLAAVREAAAAAAALPAGAKVKPVRPLPPSQCSFRPEDEIGTSHGEFEATPTVTALHQSGEEKAQEARRAASEKKLQQYCAAAHGMQDLSALCLSGGGIRSAAFALGVVQGLAKRDLLQNFDYLSTVSGGGYLGSFLTAWVQRQGYGRVCDELSGKVAAGSPLQYLRSYSSYLTPDRGPFTADTLSVVAIYVRNLFLNWLIIVPLILAVLILLKAYAAVIWSLSAEAAISSLFVLGAIYAAGIATMESLRQRPGWESTRGTSTQFQLLVKWVLFASGIAASIVAFKYLQHANELLPLMKTQFNVLPPEASIGGLPDDSETVELLHPAPALAGLVLFPAMALCAINFISWMIAYFISPDPGPQEISTRDMVRSNNRAAIGNLVSFTLSGAIAGAFLGLLFYLVAQFWHFDLIALIVLCLGPPAVVSAVFLGETIHVGLTSTTQWSDGEREWLATAAGHHGRIAVAWTLFTLVAFGGSYVLFYLNLNQGPGWFNQLFTLGTTGGLAGVIVAWLGKASATAATLRERYNTWKNWSASIVLTIATPVFLVITVSFLSAGIDYLTAGEALSFSVIARRGALDRVLDVFPLRTTELADVLLVRLGIAFIACASICAIASWFINTNRFSLHGLYRNRLIRAFLGGSRAPRDRKPNPLSQFDENDNLNLCDLWPNRYGPRPGAAGSTAVPLPAGAVPPQFLVINCALNVLKSDNLAWQERKALSLTCTPRAVGAAALDEGSGCYRSSRAYGSPHDGISLGTAMTISGAAVSPNMGYHSSPALSVLMTFFNVRLGAWLGNPGPSGARVVSQEGPRFSAKPLIQEALGLATEDKSYVYLSDGGHFENLGLYEMVRRRCRYIVLSDAGCDPGITFEDLGNAVRKISIDLNVTIEFDALQIPPRKEPPTAGGYVAIAKIIYPEAHAQPGQLLYIKPSYRGTEPASVRAYAEANPAFPHEPTSDQMFGESQFEAYRALGEYIIQTIDGQPGWQYQSIESFMTAVNVRLVHAAATEAHAKAK
jgi:Patatin-like phospholipase